jgi:hypothetical protein
LIFTTPSDPSRSSRHCLSRHLGASLSKATLVEEKCRTGQNCISKTTKSKNIAENTARVGLWIVLKKATTSTIAPSPVVQDPRPHRKWTEVFNFSRSNTKSARSLTENTKVTPICSSPNFPHQYTSPPRNKSG